MVPGSGSRAWGASLAVPLALLVAAVGEVLAVPGELREAGTLGVALFDLLHFFWPLTIVLGVAAAAPLVDVGRLGRRLAVALALCAGCGGAALTFALLVEYRPFLAPVFAGAWLALALLLALCYASVAAQDVRPRWRWLLGGAAVLAAVASFAVSAASFDTRYPTLHLALLGVRVLALHAGFACLLCAANLGSRRFQAASALLLATATAAALAVVGAHADKRSMARSLVLEYAPIGQVASIRGGADHAATCDDPPPPLSRAAAAAIFAEHAGLPPLPADLDVSDHNILFVQVETWRFDRTSLAVEDGPTPALARLAHEPDALWMSRAYSPSVRTWLSVSSLFSMTHPSHARMLTKVPPWKGDLLPEQETVAEVLAAAGYDTFAVRHGFKGNAGINQGFSWVHEETNWQEPRDAIDHNIAGRAIDAIAARARGERPFFGWIFFVSPHGPYLPPEAGRGRYDAALAHVDRQLERVLDYLRAADLYDDTIVIVTGDHGEGLGEHRQGGHGANVFEEAIHVPLVIRIPGQRGGRIDAPVSTVHVFPWLLSRGNLIMRQAARERITADLAPMLAAVGAHAVVENWTANTNLVALVGERYKSVANLRSGMHAIYDLERDPAERTDLSRKDDALRARRDELLSRYLDARACRERAQITRDPGPPSKRPNPYPPAVYYQSRAEAALP